MNPKKLNIRAHPETGELWLVEERYRAAPRLIRNMNSAIMLCLGADVLQQNGTKRMERRFNFPGGEHILVTTEVIEEAKDD